MRGRGAIKFETKSQQSRLLPFGGTTLGSTGLMALTPSTTALAPLTMNSALDKLYNELLNDAEKGGPEEITDAERAKRFLEEKQVTIDKLREVRMRLR